MAQKWIGQGWPIRTPMRTLFSFNEFFEAGLFGYIQGKFQKNPSTTIIGGERPEYLFISTWSLKPRREVTSILTLSNAPLYLLVIFQEKNHIPSKYPESGRFLTNKLCQQCIQTEINIEWNSYLAKGLVTHFRICQNMLWDS